VSFYTFDGLFSVASELFYTQPFNEAAVCLRYTMFVFYIDDDPDDRNVFLDAVNSIYPSIHCLTARDGLEGLRFLRDSYILPDLIFLDVNMPVMDGWEFMRELKMNEHLKDIPVIVYSTYMSQNEMDGFKKLGAHMCLKKQAGYGKLCQELGSILRAFQS
jgi:CheY-like chemotaxis protein